MKKVSLCLVFTTILASFSCAPAVFALDSGSVASSSKRPMGAVELLSLKRASSPKISPDGKTLLYLVSNADWQKNKVTQSLWRTSLSGHETDKISDILASSDDRLMIDPLSSDIVWSPDSKRIAFVDKRHDDKVSQIYSLFIDGGEAQKLTTLDEPISSLKWSADGKYLYFLTQTPESKADKKRISDKDDMFGFENTRKRSILRRVSLDTKEVKTVVSGNFDVKSYALTPKSDSFIIVKTPSRLRDEASKGEIWLHNNTEETRLTNNNYAETSIEVAHDGQSLLYLANAKNGVYDTVNTNLFLLDIATKKTTELLSDDTQDKGWEIVEAKFAPDGKTIWFSADEGVRATLNSVNPQTGLWKIWITGDGTVTDFVVAQKGGLLSYVSASATKPAELYILNTATKKSAQITRFSDEIAQKYSLPKQEAISWKSFDGQPLEGLLTYPLDYVAGQKYPLIVQIHGGPRSVDQFNIFSYGRLNPLLAARGIMTISVNYRGGTAYGDAFLQGMNGGYFRLADKDVLSGVDELITRGLVDGERLGVMGWSAGGHMTNHLITVTDRFKAAASGAGAVEWKSMYLTSDTRWQRTEWFETPPYGSNARHDLYDEASPMMRLDKVKTPTLIMSGAEDERVHPTQSIMFYRALKGLGVETELYLAPREPHNFTELRHRLFQMNKYMDWFSHHLLGTKYRWEKAPEEEKATISKTDAE